jgi:hypothetical protein
MWCSTSVPTGGRTLEGHTKSSNSARNAFSHSGDSGGGAGGLAALSAAAPPPQLPVDSGGRGVWTALAAQAAAAETVEKIAAMMCLLGGWRQGRPTACGCAKNRPQ